MKIVYIDPSIAGISGNMMLAALLDLGAEEKRLREVVKNIAALLDCKIRIEKKKAAHGLQLEFKIKEGKPFSLKDACSKIARNVKLGNKASEFSVNTAKTLIEAEAASHKIAPGEIHFHELGSADTLIDILGTAALAENLGFFENTEIYSSLVNAGGGVIKTSHGLLPIPAPATLEILKKFKIPFKISPIEKELATPTGVAILANLVDEFKEIAMKVEKNGGGAGTFDLKGIPDILRIFVGSALSETENVSVLETSVDDVSGEVIGYTIERLYERGALDMQVMPAVTKKNRPGHLILVVCKPGDEKKLAEVLMKETGTLGVRIRSSEKRFYLEREIKEINIQMPGYKGKAKVKIAGNNVKAEYEDAKRIATATGLPLRTVIKEIERQAKQ